MKFSYDNYMLSNIVKHHKYEPFFALDEIEDYLMKYPNDPIAYTYYIKILIDIGKFEQANTFVQFVEKKFPDFYSANFLLCKIRLCMMLGDYDYANCIYKLHKNDLLALDPKSDIFEIIYQAIVDKSNGQGRAYNSRYLYNQIVEYHLFDFMNHIKKHLAIYNEDKDILNPVMFNVDFPIKKIVDVLKETIPNEKVMYYNFFGDYYAFKYDANGRVDNKTVDYFRVVTIHNTNHFITMYPLVHGDNLPYIDLNYLREDKESSKVRRLSMVDKFNKRYGDFNK